MVLQQRHKIWSSISLIKTSDVLLFLIKTRQPAWGSVQIPGGHKSVMVHTKDPAASGGYDFGETGVVCTKQTRDY